MTLNRVILDCYSPWQQMSFSNGKVTLSNVNYHIWIDILYRSCHLNFNIGFFDILQSVTVITLICVILKLNCHFNILLIVIKIWLFFYSFCQLTYMQMTKSLLAMWHNFCLADCHLWFVIKFVTLFVSLWTVTFLFYFYVWQSVTLAISHIWQMTKSHISNDKDN